MEKKPQNILKKIINLVLDFFIVILGFVLLITIYNNIQIKVLGNDYPSFFGYSLFEVQTGSMVGDKEDSINAGDWIVVKYSNKIELDDVVTFEYKDEFITHRVIEKYNDTLVTKGDANNAKDSPITIDQVVGKVVKILPTFGILRKTIFNPAVLICLIVLFYLICSFLKKEEPKNEKDNKLMGFLNDKKELLVDYLLEKKNGKVGKKVDEDVVERKIEITETKVEITEKVEPEVEVKETVTTDDDEIDLDQTVFFRMISVNKDEIGKKYDIPEEEEPVVKFEEEVKEEVEDDSENKKLLEMIQKKKKKCNNFIEKAFTIKQEELEEMVSLLNLGEKYKVNEPTIKDILMDVYIKAKYYNDFSYIEFSSTSRNLAVKVEKYILDFAASDLAKYKGTDAKYSEKYEKFVKIFLLINRLEEDYNTIDDLVMKKEAYVKKITKYMKYKNFPSSEMKILVTEIVKVQRKYHSLLKFVLEKVESGMFALAYESINNEKSHFVSVTHNLTFSKIYSDYIVDKTYSEGVIAEDKLEVLANLLSAQIVKDMVNKNYNKKYYVYVPITLFNKEKKLERILKLLDDSYAKDNVVIVTEIESINENKKLIKKLIKDGYHFGTDINGKDSIYKKDDVSLYLVDDIFVSKNDDNYKGLSKMSKEIKDKIIDDKIFSRVNKV